MVSTPCFNALLAVHSPADETIVAVCDALRRYQVCAWVTAEDEAVDYLAQVKPDLVLFYADSQIRSGIRMSHALQQVQRSASIPVVLLVPSGRRRKDQMVRLMERLVLESGADDALTLPLQDADMQHLLTLVQLNQEVLQLRAQNAELQERLTTQDEALRKAQRGHRELSILKDSIVNNVSHELRTPLLQVKSAVAMLDAEVKNSTKMKEMKRLLDFAMQATSRLESVMQNITQLATSLSLRPEPMRVIDAVNLALRGLQRRWELTSETERVKVKVGNIPLVRGDKNGIGQVLQQLLDNALKFSSPGSPVEVTARYDADREVVVVSVTDEGIGLDMSEVERIFQEFYQIDPSATRRYSGAGTGLAVVKLILDNLGAPIEVISEPQKGSTFRFPLPIVRPEDL